MLSIFSGATASIYISSNASINGDTLYVGGDGPGNYTTIQHAVNMANDGDTVFVYNGTYVENVLIEDKSITLVGEDKNTTIVVSAGMSEDIIAIIADDVNINGFTVKKGDDDRYTYGISFMNDLQGYRKNISVSDCDLINNDEGIYIGDFDNVSVGRCNFIDNDVHGLSVIGYDKPVMNTSFFHCRFENNDVSLDGVSHLKIENCDFYLSDLEARESDYLEFYNCSMDYRLYTMCWLHSGSNQIFDNCTFTNITRGESGIDITGYSEKVIIRNCVFKNEAEKGDGRGIFISHVEDVLIQNCTMKDLYVGVVMWSLIFGFTIENCHFENNIDGFFNHDRLCTHNKFLQNNFINNTYDVDNDVFLFINIYKNNYWDKWKGRGPHRVLRTFRLMDLFNWDWNPVSEPYDI